MSTTKWLNIFALGLAAVGVALVGFKNFEGDKNGQLLNVSYDPTREVYKEINSKFIVKYETEAGHRVNIEQSHGGSSRQARAVAEGLAADVVTLALPSDIESLSKTFALAKEGDVHLTWENEALREVAESKGELEVVYPPVSILAEPSVTWVDVNADKHKSELAAKAYLAYLFTDAAQEIFAKDGYRPINEAILKKHGDRLPKIELFPVNAGC